MKTKLTLLIAANVAIMLGGFLKADAQNIAPFWSTSGNSNATAASKLGTTNAINLGLFTNNLERVHINSSNGFVGLGIAAPLQRLHVSGHGIFTGNIGIGTTTPIYRLHVITGGVGIFSSSSTNRAVFATSAGSDGIYGRSTAGNLAAGVFGESTSSSGIGVKGKSLYQGVYGNGGNYGVFGESTNGNGVYGIGGGIGVVGTSSNSTGYGVYGGDANNSGVYGSGFIGVQGSGTGYSVYGSGGSYSVAGFNTSSVAVLGQSGYLGVYGLSTGTSSPSYGVLANNSGSGSDDYGVYASGLKAVWGNCTFGGGTAVSGNATGSGTYAGLFTSSLSIGVYGYTGSSSSWAGYFLGRVFSSAGFTTSDRKLKQNITDVTDAMDIINKLQPKYYEFRQDGNYKLMNLPQGKHYGLIAQDVEQILPNLVTDTEFDPSRLDASPATPPEVLTPEQLKAGLKPTAPVVPAKKEKQEIISIKALNYTELIPVLIKAMQELGKENVALKNEISELKALVNRNGLTSNVYDMNSAYLEQNTPNPFNNAAIIRYHVPQTAGSAKLVVTDMSGKTIRSISLNSRGSGEVTINSVTLASGGYNYTLWMDGKQVDSKKMIIAR